MISKKLLTALLFLPIGAVAQTQLGYTSESVSRSQVFRYTPDTDQRVAMRLSAEKLQALKGKTIKSLRIAFGSKNSTDGKADIFVTRQLGGTPVSQNKVTVSTTNKFVEYALSTPYTITGDEGELYVGAAMTIASNYGPFTADFSKDLKGVCYVYGNGGWQDMYGLGYGVANIEVVLNETVDLTDVVVKNFTEERFLHQGTPIDCEVQVQNYGTTTIQSLDAVVQIGNGAARTISFSDLNLAPHKTYNMALSDVVASRTGLQDIRVNIVKVNGAADADETDNSNSCSACFYPADMQKTILLEMFTGQTCSNCPNGHSALEQAIQATGVDVVEIAHHSGFITDCFSMKEDWTLTSLYNGATYAPAAMFDRTDMNYDPEKTNSPVEDCQNIANDKAWLLAASKERPYVSIGLDTKYDEATRNVTLSAKFYTHEDLPGEDIRYSIWLVQDGIVAPQSGGATDYVHNNVSRGVLTNSAWGESAEFVAGSTLKIEKTFTLPEVITSTSYEKEDGKNAIATDLANMKMVVFVHQMSSNDVQKCRVFNAAEVHIGKSMQQGGFPGPVRKLIRQTYFGDTQGYESDETATRTLDYAYDANNNLLRGIETSKNVGEDEWQLTHYYKYIYDEQGLLQNTHSLQYGTFDYDDLGWLPARDTISYEYDAMGRLITETHPYKTYNYTYNDEGLRISRSTWNKNSISGELSNDIVETYGDFDENGNPHSVTATSPVGKEWNNYTDSLTYDADGHCTSMVRYDVDGVIMTAEYWTWVDGILREHRLPYVYDDVSLPSGEREVFNPIDGDINRIEHYIESFSDDKWYRMNGTRCIDEYAYLEDAPLQLTLEEADHPNSVGLFVGDETPARIFRSGVEIASDCFWAVDYEVKNGTYEYMALCNGRASNIITYEFAQPLPTVTRVRLGEVTTDITGETLVTIEWNNPEDEEWNGFQHRHIFAENMRTPEVSTDDINATSLTVTFGDERVRTFFVQSQYIYGRTNSGLITIDLDNLDSIELISSPTSPSRSYGQPYLSKGLLVKDGHLFFDKK